MKKIQTFKSFINEEYNEPEFDTKRSHASFSSKEDLVEELSELQSVYSLEDLNNMNLDQLKNLYHEVLVAKEEEAQSKEPVNELEYESAKWIKDAIKRPGSLRRKLRKKEGEKITSSEIDSELQALKAKDKDKDQPGLQLSKRDRQKHKQLVLAKTLRGMRK